MLRPFNYDTLAVHAFRLASDERLASAAIPSLLIATMGLGADADLMPQNKPRAKARLGEDRPQLNGVACRYFITQPITTERARLLLALIPNIPPQLHPSKVYLVDLAVSPGLGLL